jgi:hypothetical protein
MTKTTTKTRQCDRMTKMVKATPRKSSKEIDADVAALARATRPAVSRVGPSRRPSRREAREALRAERLRALQHRMAGAVGDDGWLETSLADLESWITVDDDLSDREWLQSAQDQLVDASVSPEHAGAPPPRVRAWNDVFIGTYRMNLDDGMDPEDAVDSARQNAHDTVTLTPDEHGLTRTDPHSTRRRADGRRAE